MNTLERKVDLLAEILLADNYYKRDKATSELKEILKNGLGCASTSIADQIENLLLEIGIPTGLKGFYGLKLAIEMFAKDRTYLGNFVSGLYVDVAHKLGEENGVVRVERCMRTAIEAAWDRGNEDVLYKYFGNSIDPKRGKPTCREFIVRMADEATKRARMA